jgi:hypothetical protein
VGHRTSGRGLGRFVVAVNVCAGLAALHAQAARADAPDLAPDPGPGATLAAGYAFRSVADGRQHGVSALASAETPSWGPLALRLDGLAMFVPGSTRDEPGDIARDLTLAGAALSLTYRFDDSDIAALLGAGPLAAISIDGDHVAPFVGALVSLGLRFPIFEGADIEARLCVPVAFLSEGAFVLPGQRALADGTALPWPLQVTFLLGVHIDPLLWLTDPVSSANKTGEGG